MAQKVENALGVNFVLCDEDLRRVIAQVGSSGPPVTPDDLVQEDGTSFFLLEDGSGHIILQV